MWKARYVTCIECHTDNKSSLSHCEKCDAVLPVIKRTNPFQSRIFLIFITVMLGWAGIFAYFSRDVLFPPNNDKSPAVTAENAAEGNTAKGENVFPAEQTLTKDNGDEKTSLKAEKKQDGKVNSGPVPESLEGIIKLPAGWVVITGPGGRQVARFRAGLSANGWLALPSRACLGGKSWKFYYDSGGDSTISEGMWISGDKVGLWRLDGSTDNLKAPEIISWNEAETVSWSSLESGANFSSVILTPEGKDGFFTTVVLPESINEAGVFEQGGNIVGWSFGAWQEKGYMWPGNEGSSLEPKVWVDNFYDMTFAGGREEKFAIALTMFEGYSRLDQLSAFTEGFNARPKLSYDDTPLYLLPEEIVKKMRILVSGSVHAGEGDSVLEMLNSSTLKSIGDIGLLMDVVMAASSVNGFESAISEIEDSGQYIVHTLGADAPLLSKLHVQLYQDWLQYLVAERDIEEGSRVYSMAKTQFSDDPYIHLLGVEIALLNDDWESAENLLYERTVPPRFQDRYQLLAGRIAELKGQEEKIVIRFQRGAARIPVTAAINEAVYQEFVVDTGASMVTIPTSTVEALSLDVVEGHRTLSTANGSVTVSEVVIDMLEINGWVEYDIRALVLDIPDRPGLGLLGLNYLGRFQMDLKSDEGTLVLAPR